jgi:tRNA-splicing endonuclease subunit Sen34
MLMWCQYRNITMSTPDKVLEPIPIFKLAHRYVLYDIEHVTYLRREHNIIGVLIGSLPQASQQNVFLGLPLELMPEEARLLVEKKVAYIVDDVAAHKRDFLGGGMGDAERRAFQAALRKQGQTAANDANKKSEDRKKAALKKIGGSTENWNDLPEDMIPTRGLRKTPASNEDVSPSDTTTINTSKPSRAPSTEPYAVTPTTSYPPLTASPTTHLPEVPSSYPVYKHLHEQGYFMAPGLRFGCKYMAYPGDPLRFHSHFLCNGMDWDQEFSLIDVVGGGRLGTGVKKGFLIGGEEKVEDGVRSFCIEWGGM